MCKLHLKLLDLTNNPDFTGISEHTERHVTEQISHININLFDFILISLLKYYFKNLFESPTILPVLPGNLMNVFASLLLNFFLLYYLCLIYMKIFHILYEIPYHFHYLSLLS